MYCISFKLGAVSTVCLAYVSTVSIVGIRRFGDSLRTVGIVNICTVSIASVCNYMHCMYYRYRTVCIVRKCTESFVNFVCIVSVCTIRIVSICSVKFASTVRI